MIDHDTTSRSEAIARLNDRCRQGFDRTARIVVTRTCLASLSNDSLASQAIAQARLLQEIRQYQFPDGVPERNRGDFAIDEVRIYFAIDCYDTALEYGSENPADASVTRRVLTIMLREDL
ncbi:DUF3768 domain-containing protein [Sphingomonas sp. XXL09]|uniref:DUF3768 domain-containing protein n=1 Tax=Sphingomonas sp. XXL09 TaxID=3457787 RepID=UPI00406BDBBE